jgi:hypothetical protein
MKVNNIQAVQNILDKPLPQPLKQGEFVMSEVVGVQDGTALLRTAQGVLLSASLAGNLVLTAGDHVETVVAEAGPGRFVLRVLDITRSESAALESGRAGADAQIFQPQTLHSALAMLKMNAGLTPKAAEFMARNGIAATPENISTLAQLAGDGPRLAQVLTQMMADVVLVMPKSTVGAGVAPIPTGVSVAAEQGGNGSPGSALQNTATQTQSDTPAKVPDTPPAVISLSADMATPASPPQSIAAQVQTSVPTGMPDTPPQVQTNMPAGAPDTPPSALTLPTDAANPTAPPAAAQTNEPNPPPPDASGQAAAAVPRPDTPVQGSPLTSRPGSLSTPESREATRPATPYSALPHKEAGVHEPASLLQRLVSLFVDLKDKENLPVRLRNAARELPAQLKELKNSLPNTDSNDRNTWGRQAELLDRQLTMMADIKRFDCYHIPLTTAQGTPSTAELYVYRQRRRKKEEAPDSYAVLIGLDTQHMGRVETMIRARGRSVALEFRLEQVAFAEAFEEGAKDLASAIAQAGYQMGDVSVRPLAAKTTVLNAEDVLTEGRAKDIGGMDIRI